MKKINNKGYMLVEIILAFVITFALIYFIMDIVIGLKSKNDDLMVETVVTTDQTIISNKLMDYAISEMEKKFDDETYEGFNCDNLIIEGQTIKYGDDILGIVDDYGIISQNEDDGYYCKNELGRVSIKIPLRVEQIPNSEFDIVVDYKYQIGDMVKPSCRLKVTNNETTLTATVYDNEDGSGLAYYGWDPTYSGENSTTTSFNKKKEKTYTYYVKDRAGNKTTCSAVVEYKVVGQTCVGICPPGYGYMGICHCYKNLCDPDYCPDWKCAIGTKCTDKYGYGVTINNSEE